MFFTNNSHLNFKAYFANIVILNKIMIFNLL